MDTIVLPNLGWNDLLRLRRVCKWIKAVTDGYLQAHPELAPEIEINGEEKSFGAFLEMGIPTSRIYLNNTSGDKFYEDAGEDCVRFIEEFGPLVKSLQLERLSFKVAGQERKFLDGLRNLESLEVERFGGGRGAEEDVGGLYLNEDTEIFLMYMSLENDDPTITRVREREIMPAQVFVSSLKSLKIRDTTDTIALKSKLLEQNRRFLWVGKALDTTTLPFSIVAKPKPPCPYHTLDDSPLTIVCRLLDPHIRQRSEPNPPLGNLKEIDFVSHHIRDDEQLLNQCRFYVDRTGSSSFIRLCHFCLTHGIKLLNVGATWFYGRDFMDDPNPEVNTPDTGIPVYSLVDLHPSVLAVNMPNLEKIEIRASQSSPGSDWRNERPDWPSLKTLDILVDSVSTSCYYGRYAQRKDTTGTLELLNFFFEDISRTAITELRLQFSAGGSAIIPNTEHIVAACPNLKKLTLINWPGTNKSLRVLWSRLPGLEEVSLESCKGLGVDAFIGEYFRYPVFLKLKILKKLSLKEMDAMPMITDTFLSLVIRHMKLSHFELTSDAPIKSVTVAGMCSLCDGDFAESIEKFPFKGWSLADVSEEDFKELRSLFRSSKML